MDGGIITGVCNAVGMLTITLQLYS
ncbi:Protein of unknown function [Pyronema omphalodes CBS 100304]|uniref:Uncharacterized protein n=1 Tax=Pyronema omphalodes (strain CBS 100304) TaxID=1076935 RepID=U4LSP4_PYROM|nr:Protein of unknown function [Pyronema omphalodes CBS 100304]